MKETSVLTLEADLTTKNQTYTDVAGNMTNLVDVTYSAEIVKENTRKMNDKSVINVLTDATFAEPCINEITMPTQSDTSK